MLGFLGALEHPPDSLRQFFTCLRATPRSRASDNVFNWNTEKFPDIEGFTAAYAQAGVQLIANIKPLPSAKTTPRYQEAAQNGLFIRDSDTGRARAFGVLGRQGIASGFHQARNAALVASRMSSRRCWSEAWAVHGMTITNSKSGTITPNATVFGTPIDMGLIRPLHALLMVQASEAAQKAHAPDKRPFSCDPRGLCGGAAPCPNMDGRQPHQLG